MRAEREIGFGPRRPARPAHRVAPARKAAKVTTPPPRRGEREAKTLLRRRRMHHLRRTARIGALVLLVVGVFTGYRAGVTDEASGKIRDGLAAAMVDLGFVVNRIEVSGLRHTREQDLMTALGLDLGDPIFAFDMDQARIRIADLGWVRSVSVARHLPDGVAIEVVERVPFAIWQLEGRFRLIDRGGVVIGEDDLEDFAGLPVVVGAGAGSALGTLAEMLATEPTLRKEMRAAVRIGERRWDILFKNGMRARLPEEGAAVAWGRLARLAARHDLLARAVHVVDLRLADRLVLRLTPEAAEAERLRKNLIGEGEAV